MSLKDVWAMVTGWCSLETARATSGVLIHSGGTWKNVCPIKLLRLEVKTVSKITALFYKETNLLWRDRWTDQTRGEPLRGPGLCPEGRDRAGEASRSHRDSGLRVTSKESPSVPKGRHWRSAFFPHRCDWPSRRGPWQLWWQPPCCSPRAVLASPLPCSRSPPSLLGPRWFSAVHLEGAKRRACGLAPAGLELFASRSACSKGWVRTESPQFLQGSTFGAWMLQRLASLRQ